MTPPRIPGMSDFSTVALDVATTGLVFESRVAVAYIEGLTEGGKPVIEAPPAPASPYVFLELKCIGDEEPDEGEEEPMVTRAFFLSETQALKLAAALARVGAACVDAPDWQR